MRYPINIVFDPGQEETHYKITRADGVLMCVVNDKKAQRQFRNEGEEVINLTALITYAFDMEGHLDLHHPCVHEAINNNQNNFTVKEDEDKIYRLYVDGKKV
jgi:hypothetical protein